MATPVGAGASLSGPHPTIANLNVILTDTASNSGLILLASCTGTPDTTADTFQKGAIMYATDVAAGASGTYINRGTSATPVWTQVSAEGLNATTGLAGKTYYVEGINGGNNAIQGSLFSAGTTKVTLVTGMIVALKLNKTLQAGANTFNLNGTSKSIFKASNATNSATLGTTYAVGSIIMLVYTPGVTSSGCWQAVSEEGL